MTKKPSYRFTGFEDEWEQQKASEIFYSVSDKNHVDLPVLSASQELGMVKRDEIGIDIKYDKASVKTYKRVKPGQFVIHLRSFQGGFAHSYIEGITSPAYTVLDFSKSNKHFNLFWKEVFTSQNFIKRLETVTYGIRDGRSISFSDFSTLKLQFPSLPEQTAIGSFFQDIDHLISLQQCKLEVLKEQKKTYLKLLFPAKGQTKPALHFAGFEDDWKEVKLGEVCEIYDGTHQTPIYTTEGVMFLSVENIRTLSSDKYISKEAFDKDFKISPKSGDVLMTRIGDIGTSNIVETDLDLAYYVSLALIRSSAIESKFLNVSISSDYFQKELWKRTLHIAFPKKINKNEIGQSKFYYPTLPEQEAIGSFFQDLDKAIAKQEEKVNQLKESKQTLLRKMFI